MYNDCFGFSESPFQITPNTKFFYQTPSYENIIATVQLGVGTRKGIIVVTGEPGTGKTLLLKLLPSSLGPKVETVVVQNPDLDLNGLLRLLLERLKLSTATDASAVMLDRLREFLIEQRENGLIVSVFIDEAQDLDKKTLDDLRILSNLEFENEALLPIVLMGQSELNTKLDDPSALRLKQRVVLTRKIYPLIRREIASYVAHRLHKAHYEGSGLFDPDAIQKIADISKGIPRTINVICDNALLKAYSRNRRIVSPQIIDEVARELRLTQSAKPERQYSQSDSASQTTERGPLAENAKSTAATPENTDFAAIQQLVSPEDLRDSSNDGALAVSLSDRDSDPASGKYAEASAGVSADRRQGRAFRKSGPRRVCVAVVIALTLSGIGGVLSPPDDFPPSTERDTLKKLIDDGRVATTLREGSTARHAITALQTILHWLGFDRELNWKIFGADGAYGKATAAAVAEFAKRNESTANGDGLSSALAKKILARYDSLDELKQLAEDVEKKSIENNYRKGGSDRVRIATLQTLLNELGFGKELNWKRFGADGDYGRSTITAVAAFGKREGIGGDGEVLTMPLAERIVARLSPFYGDSWWAPSHTPTPVPGSLSAESVAGNNNRQYLKASDGVQKKRFAKYKQGRLTTGNQKPAAFVAFHADKLRALEVTQSEINVMIAVAENEENLDAIDTSHNFPEFSRSSLRDWGISGFRDYFRGLRLV